MKHYCLLIIILILTAKASAQEGLPSGIDKNFLIGNFDYRCEPSFVEVSGEHSFRPLYLQKPVYEAFIKMFREAKKDGVSLRIVSGTRSFHEQKVIWEKKWAGLGDFEAAERPRKILEFSSMPATSRHHWGTDLDLNNLENSYFETGRGKKEYDWLVANAHKYGFHQVYTSKSSGRTGYEEEKWHWSYMPLASLYLRAFNAQIGYADITGFEGSEFAEKNRLITDYVNGISLQPRMAFRLASLKPVPAVRGAGL